MVTMLRVNHELERIGDYMVNVAKATRRLQPEPLDPRILGILDQMRTPGDGPARARRRRVLTT